MYSLSLQNHKKCMFTTDQAFVFANIFNVFEMSIIVKQ